MQEVSLFDQPIGQEVWDKKYRFKERNGQSNEKTIPDSHMRVAKAIFVKDPKASEFIEKIYNAMVAGYLVPAGRILAGAGTGRNVTLINCFVSNVVADSMRSSHDEGVGIMDSLRNSALTMQMGGGIGIDFSPLRPSEAHVNLGTPASGPLPFMDMWAAMCKTIMSSGSRRGAMMATLRCDHPDIEKFIEAKREKGRLTTFNLSILITDAFMDAIKNDEDWGLFFDCPPADISKIAKVKQNGKEYYLYKTIKARELWDKIIKNTYKYSEPGVIFIDRINKRNNLFYCEEISCVNPCGEQPLPPNGDCNLSAVNLAVMVDDPFGEDPQFDNDVLDKTVEYLVRFLDNVLDVTYFPTDLQRDEALAKRRIGLGITGLANMLQQMKLRYGSPESIVLVKDIMRRIAHKAYAASIELAKERGSFPAFDEKFLDSYFVKTLPKGLQIDIRQFGIRNGVLLTIAPTGTISLYYGNVSSGLEPTFAFTGTRKMLMPDDSTQLFDVDDYGYRLYCDVVLGGRKPNGVGLPSYMVTANELSVRDHLMMQAACQEFIDSSISKTINCPKEITFEEFQEVYIKAYEYGLKGCTTYRPSDIRGSILTNDQVDKKPLVSVGKTERPEVLDGRTYKVKWPGKYESNYYITITDNVEATGKRVPFEMFISTKDVKNAEWITALCRTISAILRRGGDVSFVCDELQQVYSPTGGQWVKGKYSPSLVAQIGDVLERHMIDIGYIDSDKKIVREELYSDGELTSHSEQAYRGDLCTQCKEWSVIASEGCNKCLSCGYSDCG